ncbi:MAG: hypothetical protein ACOYOE_08560 [Chlorobium sp.]
MLQAKRAGLIPCVAPLLEFLRLCCWYSVIIFH